MYRKQNSYLSQSGNEKEFLTKMAKMAESLLAKKSKK